MPKHTGTTKTSVSRRTTSEASTAKLGCPSRIAARMAIRTRAAARRTASCFGSWRVLPCSRRPVHANDGTRNGSAPSGSASRNQALRHFATMHRRPCGCCTSSSRARDVPCHPANRHARAACRSPCCKSCPARRPSVPQVGRTLCGLPATGLLADRPAPRTRSVRRVRDAPDHDRWSARTGRHGNAARQVACRPGPPSLAVTSRPSDSPPIPSRSRMRSASPHCADRASASHWSGASRRSSR